jgi:hypothetical protein
MNAKMNRVDKIETLVMVILLNSFQLRDGRNYGKTNLIRSCNFELDEDLNFNERRSKFNAKSLHENANPFEHPGDDLDVDSGMKWVRFMLPLLKNGRENGKL